LKLVIWGPTALLADGIAAIIGREPDVEVLATPEIHEQTLDGVDGLLVHAVPLDECRHLLSSLSPAVASTLVAVLLARSPESLFVSQARLFGFTQVIDLDDDTPTVVDSIIDHITHGSVVGVANLWSLDTDPLLESHFCTHCRDARDVEILRYIVEGYTDARIAKLMNLNAQTVRNRVSNMLLESGMANRTQLAIDFYHWTLALNGADSGVVGRPSTIRES
jgi:DNA-binding NarL/FixJ family response regulator